MAAPSRVHAQACDSVWSRTTLAAMSGLRIRSVRVETHAPDPLPSIAGILDHLHVRTRESTVQRILLVEPGDSVDTLRMAESLRRLRQLRYLGDAALLAIRCNGGPVDLTVVTRDLWSAKPSVQLRSTSQAFAFTDRNVLGTGREVTLGFRSDLTGVGVTTGLTDPWFLGHDMSLGLATSGDGERGQWSVQAQKHEHSMLDPWNLEAFAAGAALSPSAVGATAVDGATIDAFRRTRAAVLGTRRVGVSSAGVVDLVGGAEYDRTAWETPRDGPAIVRRDFVGGDAGFLRRSVGYDTVTWLLSDHAIVDIPLSTEGDVLVGVGRDRVPRALATHVDAWAGRMWMLGRRALLVADVWGSGYRGGDAWSAATARAALTVYGAARGGVWSARVDAERWFAPDPDVLSLTTQDPVSPAYLHRTPLPVRLLAGSVERDVHLWRLTRSWTLDAGAFAAGSSRGRDGAAVVGGGFRLAPARLGRVTARLDVGVPVLRSGEVRSRPFVAIGITPWLDQDRARDGRRERP